uniref:NADH-ubiquinone oxidoreductase chain 5 n=1 Tax=Goniada japonica TaxID=1644143 RepID=A0A0F6T5Y4_9ANNE|nr:NADH dehydrogenase subunit 5 [Goniada japonica]AKE32088.1 NADH dehydrogenase subunit 5 [Goniada japonica]
MKYNISTSILWSRILWILMTPTLSMALWLTMMNKMFILEWSIMSIMSTELILPIIMDPKGMMFSSAVLFISANVIHFANLYMEQEIFIKRFIHLVLLFVLSMNFLIYIPHIMGLLLGWDGLGITSFVLVIYYQNPKSLAAGMITALTNRVGDVMILLSIGWSINQGHWNIMNMWSTPFSPWISMCIMIAAMTKSAQVPFSSWLPAAMAAPTPVSALVHSSTLVTAGVFLIIRFYPFLHQIHFFNMALLLTATMTMFMAGISALVECDLKKIIALSTLSQLGVMMASIGLNLPNLAFFHLITHAMFKALLFVCAGTLIHLHHHGQDLRSMGNLSNQMPLTTSCLTTANMALCGLPFMAGFYSKDMIIEMSLYNPNNILILIMFIIATMCTAAYSMRMMMTAIMSENMSIPIQYTSDNSTDNSTPMLFMSMGAIMGGASLNWLILYPMQEPIIPAPMKLMAFSVTILGAISLFLICKSEKSMSLNIPLTHHSSALMWFLVPLSSQAIIYKPLIFGHSNLKIMDQGWIETSGGQGSMMLLSHMSKSLQTWQFSSITTHLSLIVMSIMLFINM